MIIGGIETEPIGQTISDKYIDYYSYRLNEKFNLIEDYQCEFKEIKGPSFKNVINSTISEYIASFLNSSGGSIYYGITDDGIIKGIKLDGHNIDEVNKLIYNNLANIYPSISPDYFQIEYHSVYNKEDKIIDNLYIVQVTVPVSPDKKNIYFIKGTELFIRVKGVTKKLIGTEIVTYIQKRLLDEEFKE
nr:ATP-binding protein [Clostridium tepidum]